MNRRLVVQVAQLSRRALLRALRQPGHVFFALIFPLVFLAVVSSGLSPAAALPGFPADSFLDFALAIPFVHGALFAAVNAAVVLCMAQALVYLAAGVLAGADVASGLPGLLVLLPLAGLVGLAFGALGTFVALRTGSSEAVQGMFPLFFVCFFLSSMNLPRELIEADWFRVVATVNPVSYLIEGIRSLVIAGWDEQALALGFGAGLAIVAAGLAASAAVFGERLTRT